MIIPKKKAAVPSAARSPDLLYLDNPSGWPTDTAGEEAALRVSAFYRAVTFRAETISIMPFYLMDRASRERIIDHPVLYPLTIRPNEVMSPAELKYVMQLTSDLKGNAYAYIGRNPKTGRVEELLPLNSDLVTLHFDSDRHLHYLYADPIAGKVYDLMPSQILHYKSFTKDGIHGISLTKYARDVIAKDKAAKTYERALYLTAVGPPASFIRMWTSAKKRSWSKRRTEPTRRFPKRKLFVGRGRRFMAAITPSGRRSWTWA